MSYSNFGVEDISRKIVLKNYTIIFGKDISSRATLKSHTIRATLKSHTIIFLVDSNIQSRQMKVGMGRARWLETTSKGHGWIGWLWYNDAKLRVFVINKKKKRKKKLCFLLKLWKWYDLGVKNRHDNLIWQCEETNHNDPKEPSPRDAVCHAPRSSPRMWRSFHTSNPNA